MPEATLVEAVNLALARAMAEDDSVVVLGEDVGLKGGVFKATEGLQQRFGAARVLDTPLAESSIAGIAQGLSLEGFLPVAEMQFADYSFPAFNQIVNEIAKVRYRSNGDFSSPLVIRAPTGGGVRGALYHSQSPEAYYCHVPGLNLKERLVDPHSPDRRPRRAIALPGAPPFRRRQGLPVHLAVRGERQLGEHHEGGGNHGFRQPLPQRPAQLLRRESRANNVGDEAILARHHQRFAHSR